MLRGTYHSMIEVYETGSEYYERAILMIKPVYVSVQREILEKEAKKMLAALEPPSIMKRNRFKIKTVIFSLISALIGAGTILIIQFLT